MRLTYSRHARLRMRTRGITEAQVEEVLTHYHTRHTDVDGNPVYVGTVNGRRLRVVVRRDSHPPFIITAIWLD
jgi:Domain of unknown function (DUF4258)